MDVQKWNNSRRTEQKRKKKSGADPGLEPGACHTSWKNPQGCLLYIRRCFHFLGLQTPEATIIPLDQSAAINYWFGSTM